MKVGTFNVNSIRSRLPVVLDWLAEHEPDALCVQETKTPDEAFPLGPIEDAGYHAAFRGEKGYNGVAILSREPLRDVAFGLDDGGPRDEARLVRGRLGSLHLVNTYVPQGRDVKLKQYKYKLEWFSRLVGFFDRHYTTRRRVLWCGDLNVAPTDIDVHDPKRLLGHVCFNPEVQKVFQRVVDWGFVDLFRKHHPEPGLYTFYDYRAPSALKQNKGWRIDHILATKPLARTSLDCFIDLAPRKGEKPSDHTPLVAEFDA
jgi:exodeoxyribonuclease-3